MRIEHRDVPVQIGPSNGHAEPGQLTEQQRRWMAVVVVQPDADHRDLGLGRREKRRIGVRRAVVRHLQYLRAQVRSGFHERALRIDLGVTRQQDARAVDGCA